MRPQGDPAELSGIVASRPQRLYHDLSWTWPIISPPEDYIGEAEQAVRLLRAHARIPVKTLLHLGCGGGHLDWTLKRHLTVRGIDSSDEMLALARSLNPEIGYETGEMRTVDLAETFDAVAVFDSITYMLTVDDLRAAFRTAYRHLSPGGVFLTYAEETKERFRQDRTDAATKSRGNVTITLVEHSFDPDPDDSMFDTVFVYLIRRPDGVDLETDHHQGGLFPFETWLTLLRETGFETLVEHPTPDAGDDIPWFVGRKAL